jgi:hypothetical protein
MNVLWVMLTVCPATQIFNHNEFPQYAKHHMLLIHRYAGNNNK